MIEFFFDCSSPWTYLAWHNIQPLAKEFGVEIAWRPILVGGIFNTVNPSVYSQREKPVPLKARYAKKDLADWARSAGLAIKMPPTVFPVNSVKAMRGCIWLGNDMVPFARAVFEAYWGADLDISKEAVLADIAAKAGAGSPLVAAANTLREKLEAVEGDMTQMRGEGGQDALNFPGRTDNQLLALYGAIIGPERRMGTPVLERYKDLKPQADQLRQRYTAALKNDVAAFNAVADYIWSLLDTGVVLRGDGEAAAVLTGDGGVGSWDLDSAHWETKACGIAGRNLTPAE